MVNITPFVSNRHAAKEPIVEPAVAEPVVEPVVEPIVEPVVAEPIVTPTPTSSLTDLNTVAEPKPPAAPKKRKPATSKSVAIE